MSKSILLTYTIQRFADFLYKMKVTPKMLSQQDIHKNQRPTVKQNYKETKELIKISLQVMKFCNGYPT